MGFCLYFPAAVVYFTFIAFHLNAYTETHDVNTAKGLSADPPRFFLFFWGEGVLAEC